MRLPLGMRRKQLANGVHPGLGSCLPRLGLTAPQLDAILNRADTDTAHDAFLTLKASKEMEEANPGIPLGQVKRKASLTASASKRRRDGTEFDGDHDHHSNSTPGGSGAIKTDQQPDNLNSASVGGAVSSNQQQQQQQQQQQATNYDFFFPDLEAMANGRYPTPSAAGPGPTPAGGGGPGPTTSPFNPYAQQSQFPFGAAPGMGGWGMNLASPMIQPDQNQGYGMGMGMGMGLGMGMGMGMPMGYGFNGGNQANFSGFGLTMPGGPGPGGQGNLFSPGGNQGAQQSAGAGTGSSSAPASTGPQQSQLPGAGGAALAKGSGDAAAEKSRRLKEAVASLTEGDRRVLEGNPMTPQEMAERFKVQEKLMSCLPEGDQNNRMLEAMQVSFACPGECLADTLNVDDHLPPEQVSHTWPPTSGPAAAPAVAGSADVASIY